MARKRHSDEDVLKLLREIELKLTAGGDVASACRSVGISDATYYNWRKRFGGMGRAQLSELKNLEKENTRKTRRISDVVSCYANETYTALMRFWPADTSQDHQSFASLGNPPQACRG